jgi:DNA ligase-1
MIRREFLQLADCYDPEKDNVAGWFISEKLDGTRCFWDGGITRGLPTESVPWASIIDPRTGQKKAKIKPVATGLWSRYGNPIMAPDWWLNQLPCCPLDGELWAGRGKFQLCRSICGGDTPDERFDKIVFAVYSTPPLAAIFSTGQIKNINIVCQIDYLTIEAWIRQRLNERGERFNGVPIPKHCVGDDFKFLTADQPFSKEVAVLSEALENTDASICYLHPQTKLIDAPEAAADQIEEYLQKALDQGGEGVVIRNPNAVWTPKRHRGILKYKPFHDAEAVIGGFTSGRETDKGGKYRGKIGALITSYKGKRLELSGLTDAEREFLTPDMTQIATQNPGKDMPVWFQGKHFKIGQTITFKYRELSDDGVPKEARYWRRRNVE